MTTAPELIWRAFGSRAPEGKTGGAYRFEPAAGRCITCGAEIAEGVPFEPRRGVAGINNPTYSGYPEYAQWGTHACPACAWLYGDPKRTHRGLFVIGDAGWWPTIKAEGLDGRPRWRDVLRRIAEAGPRTPMTGVLTTDPKPRLWPRARLAVCGAPGLYLHIPDQDCSGWTTFRPAALAAALNAVDAPLAAGAAKSAIRLGLWRPAVVDKLGIDAVAGFEAVLAPLRATTEFAIAITVA